MREELIHFIWKYKKLSITNLRTTNGELVEIIEFGLHNHLAGPDFFNAKLVIAKQLWAGNVEMHVKSSDWYAHRHEKDAAYDSVILHVVWEDDLAVFRKDGSEIPTLELKNYIDSDVVLSYQNLLDKRQKTFINCEKNIAQIDKFTFQNWLERLYFERLERKSATAFKLLEESKNDWEQVLFSLLLKNFGLKINGDAFLSLSQAIPFSTLRKLQADVFQLEAVFFGMSHLLTDDAIVDSYYIQLITEYQYLKAKFDLDAESVRKPDFFKLRPPNFPTIRLSQLANLYGKHQNLFDKVISAQKIEELYSLFEVSASAYWNDHFTFGRPSKRSSKKVTRKFIDLLIINTILPLKFCHAKHVGNDINDLIFDIITKIKSEENSIISNFRTHKVNVKTALESQSLLQLYNEYCSNNSCLECAVGCALLQAN